MTALFIHIIDIIDIIDITSAWRLEVAKEKRLIYNALNTLDL